MLGLEPDILFTKYLNLGCSFGNLTGTWIALIRARIGAWN